MMKINDFKLILVIGLCLFCLNLSKAQENNYANSISITVGNRSMSRMNFLAYELYANMLVIHNDPKIDTIFVDSMKFDRSILSHRFIKKLFEFNYSPANYRITHGFDMVIYTYKDEENNVIKTIKTFLASDYNTFRIDSLISSILTKNNRMIHTSINTNLGRYYSFRKHQIIRKRNFDDYLYLHPSKIYNDKITSIIIFREGIGLNEKYTIIPNRNYYFRRNNDNQRGLFQFNETSKTVISKLKLKHFSSEVNLQNQKLGNKESYEIEVYSKNQSHIFFYDEVKNQRIKELINIIINNNDSLYLIGGSL